MIRERHKAGRRLARIAALPALALAVATQAQTPGSVQDYRLPPAAPTPTPTAAGPVDSDHPVAAPTRPPPTPTPSASPGASSSPAIALPSPAATQPAARPSVLSSPRAERAAATPPISEPSALPATPTPATAAASTAAAPGFETLPSPAASTAPAPVSPNSRPAWPWAAGGAGLVALIAFLFWRRRRVAEDEMDYEPAPPAEAQPSPPAALTPPPRRAPEPVPAPPLPVAPPPPAAAPSPPLPAPTFGPRPLEMQLEARHLSRAMVNATLAYRLTLTNRANVPLGPLHVVGDITSAHASLSAQEQLSLDGESLAVLHEAPALGPGESLTLSGELRLPLASILPIHSGGARVFVPLARFRIESAGEVMATRVFVVGQASDAPGGALRPFPLDRGPGVDRALGQRELELPA